MNVEAAMPEWLRTFCWDETGQDIIEYSLLITFIAIACLALVGAGQPAVNGIWTWGNARISEAAQKANGG